MIKEGRGGETPDWGRRKKEEEEGAWFDEKEMGE